MVKHVPYEVLGKEVAWCKPKPTNLKHSDHNIDPLPEHKIGKKVHTIVEKFNIQIQDGEHKSQEFIESVKTYNDQVKEVLYKNNEDKYRDRTRLF